MKTTLRLIKLGGSRGVIIPSHIVKALKLKEGNLAEIEIKKADVESQSMSTTLKILKLGKSKGVIIPLHIIDAFVFKEGSLIELDIIKVELES